MNLPEPRGEDPINPESATSVERQKRPNNRLVAFLKRMLGSKAVVEATRPEELEVMPNRVVVFGSRISGAQRLAIQLAEHLGDNDVPRPLVYFERDVALIEEAFYGRVTNDELANIDTLPAADTLPGTVVVLPEMRYYGNAAGMFVTGHVEYIEELCRDKGVPVVIASGDSTYEQVDAQVLAALAPSNI